MTISHKPYKKKVMSSVILISKKKKLYIEIHHLNKNTIDINHVLL